MIQRIQSIWLLLASACAFLTIKLPFYSGTNFKGVYSYPLTGSENYLLLGVTIAVGIIAFINIFLFKKRGIQIFICVLGILTEGALIYLYFMESLKFSQGTYSLTSILHILVLIFFTLAIRGIRKDDKLIKDSDRLR